MDLSRRCGWATGALLFSDLPNNRTLCWLADTGEVSVFHTSSGYAQRARADKEGRLISFEQDPRWSRQPSRRAEVAESIVVAQPD
jgi:sugar lactone lactonase YvrE